MASFHHPTVPAHGQRPVPYGGGPPHAGAPMAVVGTPQHHAQGHVQVAQVPQGHIPAPHAQIQQQQQQPQQPMHHHHHQHHPPPHNPHGAPPGTFAPGTKIQVGNHRIVITKYLSEGGFAHVYLVKLARAVDGTDVAVLKRVAVPDKESLRGMRTEVETMKRLKGHRPIVTYIDSHASELKGGGYEVFLLMEFCNGGGLIDFMNTRLQHRLTEPEILAIFTDVAEGVACMHYLKPALLHRDLKVENVLITTSSSGRRRFKLCDFGSAAPPRPAPTTIVECRLMDEDVQKHTTLQYRAPEMIDVYRKQPLDEKTDIWALGVLLYKLCYYTTPFEDQGQLAILNASFRYPSYPVFTDRLKALIGSMLKESQSERPNIYQALREACAMQGREVPIHDIYTRSPSITDTPTMDRSSSTPQAHTPPIVGAVFSSPSIQQQSSIPDVVPMRRGRPNTTPATTTIAGGSKPSPSPGRVTHDPFAALDSSRFAPTDEISSRFPSLDQFSLLHDNGAAQFDFDNSSPPLPQGAAQVTGRAMNDAFAAISNSSTPPVSRPVSTRPKSVVAALGSPPVDVSSSLSSAPAKPEMSRAQAIISGNPELQAISSGKPTYVSTGTMTTPSPPPSMEPRRDGAAPIYRFPDPSVRANLSRPPDDSSGHLRARASQSNIGRTSSLTSSQPMHHKSSSSRPSLEGGRPEGDFIDLSSPPPFAKPRPASTIMGINGEPDWLPSRDKSSGALPSSLPQSGVLSNSPPLVPVDTGSVESNVDFLRSMEESDPKKKDKSGKHGRRGSSLSLAGTKNILAGKFGDAFKRFEGGSQEKNAPVRTPSPLKEVDHRLTPIAGSEATDGRSDDGQTEEPDDMTPEMRREMERMRLSEEERRVEAAQAEYRQRVAQKEANPLSSANAPPLPKSIGGVSRAVSIQNRVQSLLEDKNTTSVPRTAQGYGKYTDAAPSTSSSPSSSSTDLDKKLPELPKKSPNLRTGSGSSTDPPRPPPKPQAVSAQPSAPIKATLSEKPPAPRKPMHLNAIPTGGKDVVNEGNGDEYLRDFAKRFPSLGAIEMVERDLDE